jgi:hypothetical protein
MGIGGSGGEIGGESGGVGFVGDADFDMHLTNAPAYAPIACNQRFNIVPKNTSGDVVVLCTGSLEVLVVKLVVQTPSITLASMCTLPLRQSMRR